MTVLTVYKLKHGLFGVFIYALIGLIGLFALLPIGWMISTSLKSSAEIYSTKIVWIPSQVTFENFIKVIVDGAIPRALRNTFIVASGTTAGSLLIGIISGYGFARFKSKTNSLILLLVLATRVLPLAAIIIPVFMLLSQLQLVNSYLGLILAYLIVTVPLTTWMLKGFFENIPLEIEEAAVLDGCRRLQLLIRIILPLAAPALAAVGMYSFVTSWNEFLLGLVISTDMQTRPVAVALALYKAEWGIEWGAMMAGCLLTAIPPMVLFAVFRKYLVQGLVEGSLKG
jgi:multiple sugar transport system permease protein